MRFFKRIFFVIMLPSLVLFSAAVIGILFLGVRSENAASAPRETNSPGKADREPAYANEPWFRDPDGLLIPVDRTTALPEGYEPRDLVRLDAEWILTKPAGLTARRVIVPALRELFAAGKQAGHEYYAFSAYRSFQTQEKTYQYWVQSLGQAEADRSSALAGHSEHQLGTTLDLCALDFSGDVFKNFGDSAPGTWLAANAFRFGFVMSYPKDTEAVTGYIHEPWHFRYVGREVAAIIRERKLIPSSFIRTIALLKTKDGDQK